MCTIPTVKTCPSNQRPTTTITSQQLPPQAEMALWCPKWGLSFWFMCGLIDDDPLFSQGLEECLVDCLLVLPPPAAIAVLALVIPPVVIVDLPLSLSSSCSSSASCCYCPLPHSLEPIISCLLCSLMRLLLLLSTALLLLQLLGCWRCHHATVDNNCFEEDKMAQLLSLSLPLPLFLSSLRKPTSATPPPPCVFSHLCYQQLPPSPTSDILWTC